MVGSAEVIAPIRQVIARTEIVAKRNDVGTSIRARCRLGTACQIDSIVGQATLIDLPLAPKKLGTRSSGTSPCMCVR